MASSADPASITTGTASGAVPAGQRLQSNAPRLEIAPSGHAVHIVDPLSDVNVPGTHSEQVALPSVAATWPGAHALQLTLASAGASLPAGHAVQARVPVLLANVPGAHALLGRQMLKLWSAKAHDRNADQPPGTILGADAEGIRVACGSGVLIVTELQRSGAKRLPSREFLRGFQIRAGERFQT